MPREGQTARRPGHNLFKYRSIEDQIRPRPPGHTDLLHAMAGHAHEAFPAMPAKGLANKLRIFRHRLFRQVNPIAERKQRGKPVWGGGKRRSRKIDEDLRLPASEPGEKLRGEREQSCRDRDPSPGAARSRRRLRPSPTQQSPQLPAASRFCFDGRTCRGWQPLTVGDGAKQHDLQFRAIFANLVAIALDYDAAFCASQCSARRQ